MNNIMFILLIMATPLVATLIFKDFIRVNKKLFIVIYLLSSTMFFYILSPKPIFIFLGIVFVLLCFYVMENFCEKLTVIDLLFSPEIDQLEKELDTVKKETDEIVQKNKVLEEELIQLKEYFRIIEEMNENLDIDKLLSEFYLILRNKFENSIHHLALIKIRKKDILEINIFPPGENKNFELEIKNNYLKCVSRREFKNCISYTIFKNYYEYLLVIKFLGNISKEKIVPQLNFLFEEAKIGFERAILFKEVEELSRIDGLTGLYLRRYFIQRLENEFLRIKRFKEEFSILMFDIDFFKKVNDTYGHLAGDKVLKEIADILKNVVKDSGLISRWGGEEFLVFLPYHNIDKSCDIAEKIRICVGDNIFLYNNEKIRVTISCGVGSYPIDNCSLEKLIEIADNRLYKAKRSGRNKVVCE